MSKTVSNSFSYYLRHDRENMVIAGLSSFLAIGIFIWLKIIYPYPNFMPPDSISYIEAADKNLAISIWPIGYSKFLRLIGSFSKSDFFLIAFQYFFLQASLLFFLFSIRYFFNPGKWFFRVIVILSVSNPLLAHICNFVSSDAIFIALSVLWMSNLIWTLRKPNLIIIIIQIVLVLFCFTFRYSALYYPVVSALVIAFSTFSFKRKTICILALAFLILGIIGINQYYYKRVVGIAQFSAFAGWQIGANALYGYAFADRIDSNQIPDYMRGLHRIVNRHMDSVRLASKRPDEMIGLYYQWDNNSPLKQYMSLHWSNDTITSGFNKWAAVAPLFSDYGKILIRKRPHSFLSHFIVPNLKRFYSPPTTFLGQYNLGMEKTNTIVKNWFRWNDDHLPTLNQSRIISITKFVPGAVAIFNIAFICMVICLLLTGSLISTSDLKSKIIVLISALWICNFLFSILSAPTELRYQTFAFIYTVPFTIIIFEIILKSNHVKGDT